VLLNTITDYIEDNHSTFDEETDGKHTTRNPIEGGPENNKKGGVSPASLLVMPNLHSVLALPGSMFTTSFHIPILVCLFLESIKATTN